jgi:hypothetical protein
MQTVTLIATTDPVNVVLQIGGVVRTRRSRSES